MDNFYSIKQVAEKLSLSESSVRNYIREGKLNAIKIGDRRTVRISASEIERFLFKGGQNENK